MSGVIDKSTAIPRVSWGIFLSIVAAVVVVTTFASQMADVGDRQKTYIDRRNAQHEAMQAEVEALEAKIHELELSFTEQHGERPR